MKTVSPHQNVERICFAVDSVNRAGFRHAVIRRQFVYRFEMLKQYFYLWYVRNTDNR